MTAINRVTRLRGCGFTCIHLFGTLYLVRYWSKRARKFSPYIFKKF